MSYLGTNQQPSYQQLSLPLAVGQGGTGAVDSINAKIGLGVISSSNDGTFIEAGTTAQRGSATTYKVRYNITLGTFEGSNGASWGAIGGGARGGGTDDIFYENSATINNNYSITAGKNAMSAGPITIANGVTVTVSDGSSWSII